MDTVAVRWLVESATQSWLGIGSEDGEHSGQASQSLSPLASHGWVPTIFPHRHHDISEPLVEVRQEFEGCCYFPRFTMACFNKTLCNLLLDIQYWTGGRAVTGAAPPPPPPRPLVGFRTSSVNASSAWPSHSKKRRLSLRA